MTPEIAARHLLADAKTCPIERVTAAAGATPAPPPDIAADPERAKLWTQSHVAPQGFTLITASGCGAEITFRCVNDTTLCDPLLK